MFLYDFEQFIVFELIPGNMGFSGIRAVTEQGQRLWLQEDFLEMPEVWEAARRGELRLFEPEQAAYMTST